MSLPSPKAAVVAALMLLVGLPLLMLPGAFPGALPPAAAAVGPVPTQTDSAGTHAPRREDPEATPLTVRLTSLAPATIPRRGRIVLQGTVTNSSSDPWRDVNVLPFFNPAAITSRDELAEAARTDESAFVGERIIDPSVFTSIGDLAPGQTSSFRIAVPRAELGVGEQPGVYWIGAHALGQGPEGRDEFADGRARTFIALAPPRRQHTAVALVFPVRQQVQRTLDGRVADADSWATLLSPRGRLGRILGLAQNAGGRPFTWLIDPAVLDAVQDLAAGNKPLSLGEPRTPPGSPSPSPSPSPSGGAGASAVVRSADELSASWLDGLVRSAREQALLGLGYADPDVAALGRLRPPLLTTAIQHGRSGFAAHDLEPRMTVAPPDGWIDESTLGVLRNIDTVLLSDHGHPGARTLWSTGTGTGLVIADEQVVEGGPAPGSPLGALALRQRILADAALRALAGVRSPLPVLLPADWDPGPDWASADFFDGLQQGWLSLVALGNDEEGSRPTYERSLEYPRREQRKEVGRADVRAAQNLIDVGHLYDQLLDTANDVLPRLGDAALSAVSYHARDESDLRQSVDARAARLRFRLDQVHVELGTDFVTMSGGEGTLTVSLVNDLQQPVTVGIEASTPDSDVRITAPKPVRVGPGERVSVRLRADAQTIGVHEVRLTAVTPQGRAFGEPLTFSLRISQVGRLIWIIMIGVGVLFFGAIVLRIVRRIRSHRWRA
ncbi:MAG TPA: DUF6049 family protein [Marmoricola sp.]|nr:DUF6049 family protein [Marmoricola sp.]